MSIQRREEHRNFPLLGEEGLFGAESIVRQYIRLSGRQKQNLKETREWVLQVSGVERLSDISRKLEKSDFVNNLKDKANKLFPGIESKSPELRDRILEDYGSVANKLIKEVYKKYLPQNLSGAQSNEAEGSHDPGKLLLYALDGNYVPQVRYEAQRKLVLMKLQVHMESTLQRHKDDFEYFNDLINNRIEMPTKKGRRDVFYLSTDEVFNNAVISQQEKPERINQANIHMRFFKTKSGCPLPFHWDQRLKDKESILLKMLRQDSWDARDITDINGIHFILRTKEESWIFQNILRREFADQNFQIYDDVDDLPIKGMNKFMLALQGGKRRYEIQLFTTPQPFVDYNLGPKAWSIYEIERVFDSSVMRLLFPPKIFGIDLDQTKKKAIQNVKLNHKTQGLESINILTAKS